MDGVNFYLSKKTRVTLIVSSLIGSSQGCFKT